MTMTTNMIGKHTARWSRLGRMNRRALSMKNDKATPVTTDIVIVGGGVVGSCLADQVRRTMPDWSVTVVEHGPCRPYTPPAVPHPRSYALSPASLQALDHFNNHNDTNHDNDKMLGPYDRMQVWEAKQPAYLQFGLDDLLLSEQQQHNNNNSNASIRCLGAVAEDQYLVHRLWSRLLSDPNDNVTMHFGAKVQNVTIPTHAADGLVTLDVVQTSSEHNPKDTTTNNNDTGTAPTTTTTTTPLACRLLVAADGAQSQIRRELGIPSRTHDYGQTALTFTVSLNDNGTMPRCAFQRFLSTGPLALLPTRSAQHAIVVWSTTPEQAAYWKDQSEAALVEHLNELLQAGPELLDPFLYNYDNNNDTTTTTTPSLLGNLRYGAEKVLETIQYGATLAGATGATPFAPPPRIAATASPRFTFPLAYRQVAQYTAPRVALIGDAAHSVHPMAGQGLNLGLDDVTALVDRALAPAHDAGMDVAQFVATAYERNRQIAVPLTVQGIHALHGIFDWQHVAAKHVKSLGMNAVQNIPALRRQLVQAACQGVAH